MMRWIAIVALFAIVTIGHSSEMLLGEWGKERQADERVKKIAESVVHAAEKKWKEICGSNCAFTEFVVETYKSQVVAGVNYMIKVKVQEDQEIIIKVFEPLPYTGAPAVFEGIASYTGKHRSKLPRN